ncbi:MAG: nucleobase:cation symporter-2 family protein [Andreesenia angusta]|nr:nucleobase:cation symporter-2 family protein [Andreesenia angusta]
MSSYQKTSSNLLYGVEDKPKLSVSIILAIQNILTAFGGIVAVPLAIGKAAGVDVADTAFLVSATMIGGGITTLLQSIGVGPKRFKIGARVPVLMGTDSTFVSPGIIVVGMGGLPAYFGATILGSFIEIILSRFLKVIMKFFPPLVTGTVVTLIGMTLIPVAIIWSGGGDPSAADFGSLQNFLISIMVLLIIVFLNRYGKGILGSSAVLIGIVIGYIVCIPMGLIDFTSFKEAGFLELPKILHFGVDFSPKYVIPFIAAYLVTTIETVGVLKAVGEASEEDLSDQRIADGVLCDGIGSLIAGFIGSGPNTSFSQNVGLIPLTKVASRHVATVAGVVLIILGIFPKLSTLIAIMPSPVLGGAGLLMFGVVGASGIRTLSRVKMDNRNLLIIATSLGIGIGVSVFPDYVKSLPGVLNSIFSSGISAGTVVALILNIVLKEEETTEEEVSDMNLM